MNISVQELVALAYAEGVADGRNNPHTIVEREDIWQKSNIYETLVEN